MRRAAPLLLGILLVPAGAGQAAAQASAPAAAVSASARSSQPSQPRRPRAYTGLDIRFAASVGADGVMTQSYPVVRRVDPESPGEQAGVLAGDVIIEVNGRDSREERVLWFVPGQRFTLRLRTGDQEREVVVVPLPPREPGTPSS